MVAFSVILYSYITKSYRGIKVGSQSFEMSRHDSSIQYNFHCHQELFASRLAEINITNGRKLVDDIAGPIDLKITFLRIFYFIL
jgi:hypothetical protein